MTYLFKATDGNKATHGGDYSYRKGRWTRHERVDSCYSGFHLARGSQVLNWLAPTLWLAEACPDHELVDARDKVVSCKVRLVERLDSWNDRTARLFAADCAEAALALIVSPDPRSLEAVAVARRFADGDATQAELDAARDAACDTAGAPAGDAAWASARASAWASAWAPAGAPASDAASDAAWAAAGAAAGASAGASAGAAAKAPAWAAARDAQYLRLLTYLELEETE